MDNITPLIPVTPPCVITLDSSQHTSYKESRIEIHSPEGEELTVIGERAQKDAEEIRNSQLRDEISLIEDLLVSINGDLELSKRSVSGLADVFFRMQDFCDKHIK